MPYRLTVFQMGNFTNPSTPTKECVYEDIARTLSMYVTVAVLKGTGWPRGIAN